MINSDSLQAIANKTALQKYISLGFSDTVNDIASFHQGLLKQACHWLFVFAFWRMSAAIFLPSMI